MQVFKQLLTQRVMRNPQQQRHFSASQLRDLFTFDEDDDVKTIGVLLIWGCRRMKVLFY